MRNYRPLVPIIIVFLMIISIYSMISGAINKNKKIDDLLQKAENCSEQRLYEKAAGYYNQIISIDNNIDYYFNVIDMYYDADLLDYCEEWCEHTLDIFPKNPVIYEKIIGVYLDEADYSEAYKKLDQFDGRKLSSEKIEEYRKKMEYLYYYNSNYYDYDDIAISNLGYIYFYKDGLWGLATEDGSKKIDAKFQYIAPFANDFGAVCDNNVWYFMQSDGEYIFNISYSIPENITWVGMYNEGLFPVCIDNKYKYYTIDFEQKLDEYDYAGAFNNGIAAVKNGEKWFLIKEDGSKLIDQDFEDIIIDENGICCKNSRLFVKSNGKYMMIDDKGNKIGTDSYDNAKLFESDQYAACMVGDLWGYVNLSGEYLINPKYEDAKSFNLGIAAIKDNDKWGYIDSEGNEIINKEYDDAFNFSSDGTAFVKNNNNLKVITLYKYNH